MKVSAVIICDLSKTDPSRTLTSLKSNVDEVVIVNTGERIINAESNIINYDSKDFSFAEARNIGIEKAIGDYIFSIDSDEVLVWKDTIKKIVDNNIVDVLYITIKQWHTYLNGKSEFQEYSLPRIFYKTDKLKYSNRIHETVSKSLPKDFTHYSISPEKSYIAHTGYDISVKDMKKKIERNVAKAMDMINRGEADAYTYYHLGKLFGVAGEIAEQLTMYSYALSLKGLNKYHTKELQDYLILYTKMEES